MFRSLRRTSSAVRARRGPAYPAYSCCSVMRHRCPWGHPLEPLFERAAESLTTALSPASPREPIALPLRSFLRYLGAQHREVCRLEQLRRDPHISRWLAELRSHKSNTRQIHAHPCALSFCVGLLEELAWSKQVLTLSHLLRREDIPRREKRLPRPLLPEQDRDDSAGTPCAATISPATFCSCNATPVCALASVSTWPPTVYVPWGRTSGLSMCRSANSKQNAWFRWIHSYARSSNVCSTCVRKVSSKSRFLPVTTESRTPNTNPQSARLIPPGRGCDWNQYPAGPRIAKKLMRPFGGST